MPLIYLFFLLLLLAINQVAIATNLMTNNQENPQTQIVQKQLKLTDQIPREFLLNQISIIIDESEDDSLQTKDENNFFINIIQNLGKNNTYKNKSLIKNFENFEKEKLSQEQKREEAMHFIKKYKLSLKFSTGFDLSQINNITNTGFVNTFNLKSKYISSDNRIDYNIIDTGQTSSNNAKKTEITNIFSDNRFEINDLKFFEIRNPASFFKTTENLKSSQHFEKIDILKYTFVSLYSRAIITNERNVGNFDQKDIIYTIGPGIKYKIFYLSYGLGRSVQSQRVNPISNADGYFDVTKSASRLSFSIEKNFKYLTSIEDEIKTKFDLSYNSIKSFAYTIQTNFTLSKQINKYSTINLFLLRELIKYQTQPLANTTRKRISISLLVNIG